jgi:hypothetical protein
MNIWRKPRLLTLNQDKGTGKWTWFEHKAFFLLRKGRLKIDLKRVSQYGPVKEFVYT